MKLLIFLIPLFAMAMCHEDPVIDMSGADLEAKLPQIEIALVDFFAAWCSDCKAMAPVYEKVATYFANQGTDVKFIKFDCSNDDNGPEVCESQLVIWYPTIRAYRNGKAMSFYKGGPKADDLIEYVKSAMNQ